MFPSQPQTRIDTQLMLDHDRYPTKCSAYALNADVN